MNNDDIDLIEEMRRDFVARMMQDSGMHEQFVLIMANSCLARLQERFGGTTIYIPKVPRRWDLLTIDSELRRGDSPRDVAMRHGTTVRHLRRMFPGGLPRPEEQGDDVLTA